MLQEQEQEPSKNIILIDYDTYHIKQVLSLEDITGEMAKDDDRVKNAFWYPNINVLNMLVNYCISSKKKPVLEIGPGKIPFPLADTFVGLNEINTDYISVNMNFETIPFNSKHFDFIYARHFLEDILNPHHAVQEITRCCKSGYIETPSPMIEIMRGVDASGKNNHLYCGYSHHHSIIWGDMENNTLYILPKKNFLLENIIYNPVFKQKLLHLINNYPVYWNQYFFWEGKDPRVHLYKDDECIEAKKYMSIIISAISCCIKNTRFFLNKFENFQENRTCVITS